jgi:CheY-like chemotaxis protein
MMQVLLADDRHLFRELLATVLRQNTHTSRRASKWRRSPRLAHS